ncbi:MAG: ABC transporter permease [Burkholderiales bacterium]
MNLWSTLLIALNALKVNKLRSTLTMLGIIIGVGAVITMLAVGNGAQARVEEQIRLLGSNVMIMFPGSTLASGARGGAGSVQSLTEDDALAIVREVPEVQVAAATMRGSGQAIFGNSNWFTTFHGVNNDFFEARDWPLAIGRDFEGPEMSGAGKVAIIGQTVLAKLFGDNAQPEEALGQTVRVRQVPFTVVGVLSRKGQSMLGADQDDAIFVPLATARNRLFGNQAGKLRRIGSMTIKTREGASMSEAEEKIRLLMRQRQRLQPGQEDAFTIRNLTEILQAQEASSKILALLLAAVAGVSLLVGGIGIMNIMLVSVTERTREIGLRMAVGARGRDILTQFLVEAVTLALIGGLLGVALGLGGSYAIGNFAGWRVEVDPDAVLLAVGFSAAIGIFFGFYPARKAARLRPIEALRYE